MRRTLVDGALEARAPAWAAAPEPVDLRPRCRECDDLLPARKTGRPRSICTRRRCKYAAHYRWQRAREEICARIVGPLQGLGKAIAAAFVAEARRRGAR